VFSHFGCPVQSSLTGVASGVQVAIVVHENFKHLLESRPMVNTDSMVETGQSVLIPSL